MAAFLPTIFGSLILLQLTRGNYRHYHFENTDICSEANDANSRILNIGTGAAIFQLDSPLKFQPDYHNKVRRCEVHLKAPQHFGIMVSIEQMHLRQNSKDKSCVDYVQFGRDDIIPFVTISHSDRICGEASRETGEKYDDPSGSLLIWLNLSGRRKTSYWPEISIVNLTLVVTAYQKDCGVKGAPVTTGFMNCGDRKKCIYQKYKCDRHYNCATDHGTVPGDEQDCPNEKSLGGAGNSSLSNEGNKIGDFGGPALNWISWSLILVSGGLMTLLFLLLCLRLKRRRRCCGCPLSPTTSCEFPDQPVIHSLADLSSQRHLHTTEQNIYLPLTTFLEQPIIINNANQSAGPQETYLIGAEVLVEGGGDFPEEPPPAYSELFPHAVELGQPASESETNQNDSDPSEQRETTEMLGEQERQSSNQGGDQRSPNRRSLT